MCVFLCFSKVFAGRVTYGSPLFPRFSATEVSVPLYFSMPLRGEAVVSVLFEVSVFPVFPVSVRLTQPFVQQDRT